MSPIVLEDAVAGKRKGLFEQVRMLIRLKHIPAPGTLLLRLERGSGSRDLLLA
jgi:hypothetical protein